MKACIALLFATLAVATQASYVPEATWPYSTGLNSWNGWNSWNGYNNWNGHGLNALPYANSWSTWGNWPVASVYGSGLYGGHKTVVQANNYGAYPWGTYGAGVYGGWGHHGAGYLTSIPVSKQVAATPGSVHVAPVLVGGEKLIVA